MAQFLRVLWRSGGDRFLSLITGIPIFVGQLVAILGCRFPPARLDGLVTLDMAMSEHIRSLIQELGAIPGVDSRDEIAKLIEDPQLLDWRHHLLAARENQRVADRDASYSQPGIQEVEDALSNGAPSNAADLSALLVDRLRDLEDWVRGDNSNPWRQFWNYDSDSARAEPKVENSCRDALLSALKLRLPGRVGADPEVQYVADTRADVRVAYSGFNVPVEIKKNFSPDLWRGVREQLIAKYTIDPATCGYGIYLVLWFGREVQAKDRVLRVQPHKGVRPSSAEELRHELEEDLTPREARKISIVVMDVTKPGTDSSW